MLTYIEYYNQMKGIQDALNAAVDHAVINTTGMTEREEALYLFGKYIQFLASATMPSFFAGKCAFPISILIHINHVFNHDKPFDFALFSPEDVEQDKELDDIWQTDFINYTRMSPPVIVGAASIIVGIDTSLEPATIDYSHWCNSQAEHLAKYCVAHGVDITKFIDFV